MTAPDFVPVGMLAKPRTGLPIPPSRSWAPDRPAEVGPRPPSGARLGRPGPDQGYALTLAQRFVPRLQLAVGEHLDDVVAGCVAVALRRASLFGRAPVNHDLDLAFTLLGYLTQAAPDELIAWRLGRIAGADHHYWTKRDLADLVPEATLRMTPAQVRERLHEWHELLGVDGPRRPSDGGS